MGVFYEAIPKSLFPWILAQKLFYVATAPLSAQGHINVSPKGGEYFGVDDERTFWYQELTGSGNGMCSLCVFDLLTNIVQLWFFPSAIEVLRGSHLDKPAQGMMQPGWQTGRLTAKQNRDYEPPLRATQRAHLYHARSL